MIIVNHVTRRLSPAKVSAIVIADTFDGGSLKRIIPIVSFVQYDLTKILDTIGKLELPADCEAIRIDTVDRY